MTETRCAAFMEDSERFASHPDECAACRKLVGELDQLDRDLAADRLEPVSTGSPKIVESLPLAAWEGAGFRSWPVAVASAAAILAIAVALFAMLGISPLEGVFQSIAAQLTRGFGYVEATRHVAALLANAPAGFHVAVGVAFIAVNALFFYLLRRAPRGIDVSSR
jgi:hypothetical protein